MPMSQCQTKWILGSDLLVELLTDNFVLRSNHNKPSILNICSDWTQSKEHIEVVRGLLTWLVSRAYGLSRNQESPDTCFTCGGWYTEDDIRRFSAQLLAVPHAVQEAIQELRDMQPFVQAQVKHSSQYANGVVKIGRGYRNESWRQGLSSVSSNYANRLLRYARAAQIAGLASIQVPHDTLTSWSTTGDYTGCEAVALERVPISQVLLNSDMLGGDNKRYRNTVESGEWIIITPAPTGMRVIEVKNVNPIRRAKWPMVDEGDVEEILAQGMPSQLVCAPLTFWDTLPS